MRSAIDHLAPAAIEASRSHLVIDGRHVRVLGLADYPRYVHPNWLERLIDFDEPLDLSIHIDPLDSATTLRRLTHKLVELQSSRLLDARSGKIASAEREIIALTELEPDQPKHTQRLEALRSRMKSN